MEKKRGRGVTGNPYIQAFLNSFSTTVTKNCNSVKMSMINPAWKRKFSLTWHLWSQWIQAEMLWQNIQGKKQCQNIHPQPTVRTECKQPSICSLPITFPQSVKGTAKENSFINTTWLLTSLQVGWGLEPPQTRDPPRDDSHF